MASTTVLTENTRRRRSELGKIGWQEGEKLLKIGSRHAILLSMTQPNDFWKDTGVFPAGARLPELGPIEVKINTTTGRVFLNSAPEWLDGPVELLDPNATGIPLIFKIVREGSTIVVLDRLVYVIVAQEDGRFLAELREVLT